MQCLARGIRRAAFIPKRSHRIRVYSTEFLKFNPLPARATDRTGLYTGPPCWPTTDAFYENFKGNCSQSPKSLDREIIGHVAPASVDPGDVVEVITRIGKIRAFGMVTFMSNSDSFDMITVDGETVQARSRDVSFALRGHFPRLPVRKYNLNATVKALRQIIVTANANLADVLPLVSVVHSMYCTASQPRALDFMFICSAVDRYFSEQLKARTADRLAVYLALAYHSLLFVRMRNSPFVVVPSQTAAAINKVMYALTRTELEHGVSGMMRDKTGSTHKSVSGALRTFLEHWILWNDPRLTRAVEAVLEGCVGNSRVLDSLRALSSVVNRLDMFDLFPWVTAEQREQLLKRQQHVERRLVSEKDAGEPARAKRQQSHLFTTNLVQGSVYIDGTLTASFNAEHSLLSIFVPRIAQLVPSIMRAANLTNVRARSASLNGEYFPLLPDYYKYSFHEGTESSAICLQVRVDIRNQRWDPASVSVSLTETVPIALKSMDPSSGLLRALAVFDPVVSDHELQLPPGDVPYSHNSILSLHAQAAAGRIAGEFLKTRQVEAPFLITDNGREVVSSHSGFHDRLGTDAYVPIAKPLDSGLCLLAQRKLLGISVPTLRYGGQVRLPLEDKLEQSYLPGLDLVTEFETRDLYHRKLKNLQAELQESRIFHIFRCKLLESGPPQKSSDARIIKAYCMDLDLDVEVVLPSHSEPVFAGDQVICTEILELDPLFGIFVVSL